MDLESAARTLYLSGQDKEKILAELEQLSGSRAKAEAILTEIINTESITDDFIKRFAKFEGSGITADQSGLGCRGEGDFYIHHRIADLINNESPEAIVDPRQQDDGGIIQIDDKYLAVAVDGMHSRLSHFPFIAGFHVARAAIRDIIVMGCEPKALFSDIHLANDGDVSKVFEYTAGITLVGELTEIPLIAGSTLRIGGDLVLGDRLTGCVGCIGYGNRITPRNMVTPGDVIIMTEGSGGGTIATTALYNGCSEVVAETINLKSISLGKGLLGSGFLENIHTLTDVTNGGLRGDAFEIANTASVRITLYEEAFSELVNPAVLKMLTELDIDPLGVSIDALLLFTPERYSQDILEFIRDRGVAAGIVGRVKDTKEAGENGPGVELVKGKDPQKIGEGQIGPGNLAIELTPEFREAPYTPVKKVVNVGVEDSKGMQETIKMAMERSLEKKNQLKKWILKERRV